MTMLDPDSDRLQPTWRKPAGILGLVIALALYAGLVARLAEPIGRLPVLAQTVAYIVLGTIWLLPLRRFLIWMETGRWG
jgi:membrane protein YdbS with pleckstrin-like domain